MKRACVIALAALGLATSSPAGAQVFGQFTGAETLPVNSRLFGAYLQSSKEVVGLLAQLRLSFYPGVDFGFHGGFTRWDFIGGDVTTLRLGTDLKITVRHEGDEIPFAIAIGGDLGVETGDDFSILTVGPTVTASRTFDVGETGGFTPYARAGVAFSRIDVKTLDDTDISIPVRLGSDFKIAPQLRLVLELQLQLSDSFNDDLGFAGGVNLPF